MKRIIAVIMSVIMLVGLCACGKEAAEPAADKKIEGDLISIIQKVYADVDLDAETKESFNFHMIEAVPSDDAETEAYLLGTADLEYAEAAYAMPMMNAVAYQLNMFRLPEGADVEAFKAQAEAAFDTGKWVCVMPEKVATVNVGDVVMFVAGTEQVVDALIASFNAQAK